VATERYRATVTDHARRPLLFLDVDGQLLPFGADPQPRPRRAATSPHLAQLSPDTGIRPAALPCTLVWATTWQEDANTEIAPRIGLPHLPVVTWPEATQLFGHAQRIVMPLTERMASDLNCAGIFLTGGGMG
jgi:hypothetical protein